MKWSVFVLTGTTLALALAYAYLVNQVQIVRAQAHRRALGTIVQRACALHRSLLQSSPVMSCFLLSSRLRLATRSCLLKKC
jgi:hypothetical protein